MVTGLYPAIGGNASYLVVSNMYLLAETFVDFSRTPKRIV